MQTIDNLLKCTPGIDYTGAMKRMSDDTVFYAELLRLFFKDNTLERLEEALNTENYEIAIYEAHSLKGTAANLGLIDISDIAAQIHAHLKKNEIEQSKRLMHDLSQTYLSISRLVSQI
jgi:HPt (histidine-containing phosphotransfer) domain-containing protein